MASEFLARSGLGAVVYLGSGAQTEELEAMLVKASVLGVRKHMPIWGAFRKRVVAWGSKVRDSPLYRFI